jgi:4-amino-4-deoxy-L-arabinose transferase-like glycosyltransferase
MLSRFSRLDQARWPILWLATFFLVQAVPATIIRASNLEEGRIVAIARGAVEDGHWLTPFVYGDRFAERPVLLSWMAALFGEATGGVTLWSLRIPHLCFFFAGALLIYYLLRSNTGKSAAIFGAFCWISMPVVAPKFINAEPDIVLSVLLFAAFCVWWQGTTRGNMTPLRWFGIGALIALAGLTKGPQPVAYFGLGVGAYLLLKDRRQIPAFIAANVFAGLVIGAWYLQVYQKPNDIEDWMIHSRLLTTTGVGWVRDHLDFVVSLTAELLPATMALGVICGLMFEHWRQRRPRVIVSALFVTYLIFGGLLLRGWVAMPFWPHLFQESRIAGNSIAVALQQRPEPLYVIGGSTDYNMLVYVEGPIRAVTLGDLAALKTPAIAVLLPQEERALVQKMPRFRLTDIGDIVSMKTSFRIVEIQP